MIPAIMDAVLGSKWKTLTTALNPSGLFLVSENGVPIPNGAQMLIATLVSGGSGGAGGGASTTAGGGGGGGGGSNFVDMALRVPSGAVTMDVAIGAGGSGAVAGSSGGAGGDTTITFKDAGGNQLGDVMKAGGSTTGPAAGGTGANAAGGTGGQSAFSNNGGSGSAGAGGGVSSVVVSQRGWGCYLGQGGGGGGGVNAGGTAGLNGGVAGILYSLRGFANSTGGTASGTLGGGGGGGKSWLAGDQISGGVKGGSPGTTPPGQATAGAGYHANMAASVATPTVNGAVTASTTVVLSSAASIQVGMTFTSGSYTAATAPIITDVNYTTNTITLSSAVTLANSAATTIYHCGIGCGGGGGGGNAPGGNGGQGAARFFYQG